MRWCTTCASSRSSKSRSCSRRPEDRQLLASTLGVQDQPQLLANMPPHSNGVTRLVMNIAGIDHQALVIPLGDEPEERVVAVLHRSLADALAAFGRLRNTLIVLAVASLLLSLVGSIAVARNITRPLETLASAAQRIEQGNYDAPVDVRRSDEIGVLASSLNHMRSGIADREKHILKLAYEDPLTDLANRSRFANLLENAIGQAALGHVRLAILMMDLDRFKYVNDTLGHGVGDHVLREVSARLQRAVAGAECVARLGGDEFAILVKHDGDTDCAETARAIIAALEAPILFEGQPLDVGTSIGIAHYPEHGNDAQTLVRNADIAMYAAKRNKTGFATYVSHYDTGQQEHLSLLGELRRAVERNELRLYYQPKVSMHTGQHLRRRGADPLGASGARPGRRRRSSFRSPSTRATSNYSRAGCCAKPCARSANGSARACRLQVSVNISARDLMNRDLPDHVAALLAEHNVSAEPAVPGDHRERLHGRSRRTRRRCSTDSPSSA